MLKKVRYLIDQSTALTLYKSLVLPHIDYCDVVYTTASKDTIRQLLSVQNVACRTILLVDKYANVAEMHRSLKLYPLEERRTYHFGKLCHKNVFNDNDKTGLLSFFIKRS